MFLGGAADHPIGLKVCSRQPMSRNQPATTFMLVVGNQLTRESAISVLHFLTINGYYADWIAIRGQLNPLLHQSVLGKPLQLDSFIVFGREKERPYLRRRV